MKQINIKNIESYYGEVLAEDVFYKGQVIFKNNTVIDNYVIQRLHEISQDYYENIFIYSLKDDSAIELKNLMKTKITKITDESISLIFNFYSYRSRNDKDLIEEILTMFLKEIFSELYFLKYLENLYTTDKLLFKHTIRVTILSIVIAIKAKLPYEIIKNIGIGALLHDIGKYKLFTSYPSLADRNHKYNYEESNLITLHPQIGYEEVKHNPLVPISSKKIILLHHVWENYEASYNKEKKIFMSYPTMLENNRINSKNKDLAVNIVQVVNYFDGFLSRKISSNCATKFDILNYINSNKEIIFSKDAATLICHYISLYSVNDHLLLSNHKKCRVYEHTNNPKNPIVMIDSTGEIINLDKDRNIRIIDFIEERSDTSADDIKKYYNM